MISARGRSNRSVSIARTHAPIEKVRRRQCTHRLREVRSDEAAHALAAAELQHIRIGADLSNADVAAQCERSRPHDSIVWREAVEITLVHCVQVEQIILGGRHDQRTGGHAIRRESYVESR